MNIFLRKNCFCLLLICLLLAAGPIGCATKITKTTDAAEADARAADARIAAVDAMRDRLLGYAAEAAAVTNEKVMALLFPESPPTNTDLNTPNITTTELGEALKNNASAAVVTGNLALNGGGTGIYGFNVNLGSGGISSGTMRSDDGGIMFNVHSGTGSVNGNDFYVGNFRGSVQSGTYTPGSGTNLTGTTTGGFGSVGDLGATGTFNVTSGSSNTPVESGTITDGQRVQ